MDSVESLAPPLTTVLSFPAGATLTPPAAAASSGAGAVPAPHPAIAVAARTTRRGSRSRFTPESLGGGGEGRQPDATGSPAGRLPVPDERTENRPPRGAGATRGRCQEPAHWPSPRGSGGAPRPAPACRRGFGER